MQICNSCGISFAKDEPIELDGFHIDPRARSVVFNGVEVDGLRKIYLNILYALAKAAPNCLSREAIQNRVSDGQNSDSLKVNIHHLRKILREHNIPSPLVAVHGYGYQWSSQVIRDLRGA